MVGAESQGTCPVSTTPSILGRHLQEGETWKARRMYVMISGCFISVLLPGLLGTRKGQTEDTISCPEMYVHLLSFSTSKCICSLERLRIMSNSHELPKSSALCSDIWESQISLGKRGERIFILKRWAC